MHLFGSIAPIRIYMVKGFGGLITVVFDVMIWFKIEYHDRKIHKITIQKSQYVPAVTICLLTPQQWSQQSNYNHPNPDETWFDTKYIHCILYLDQ